LTGTIRRDPDHTPRLTIAISPGPTTDQVSHLKRDRHGGQHVTPKGRERAYEKRRYEEWQARLAAKRARNRRIQRISLITAAAVATVAVIGGGFWLLTGGDDDNSPAASATPSSTASAAASATATPSASPSAAAVASTCPAVTVKPPATPEKFAKAPPPSDAGGKNWNLTLNTTCGKVTAVLDGKQAPQAVSAMLLLAKSKFFDGSPCHRLVTSGIYVLQCGDPTGTGTGGPGFSYGPVENAPKDYVYPAGTIAMARSNTQDSNGSQFFIVYKDSTIGDATNGAYTVLGKITQGLDVVNKVAAAGVKGGASDGAPNSAISIASTAVSAG
jgi:peptidyl-prolyl cis-trans isomerase B (cyclophilin B)